MAEAIEKTEAVRLLVERGFTNFVLEYHPNKLMGLRWFCEIKGVFAPVLHGVAWGYGFTARDAVLKTLACNPMRE
ncbi:hypothetical protein HZA26_00485 [Candidatus Nomurabacteria bacterium]|nr:hypothetical protein [Candidatus Nomurabacteria bacterium]